MTTPRTRKSSSAGSTPRAVKKKKVASSPAAKATKKSAPATKAAKKSAPATKAAKKSAPATKVVKKSAPATKVVKKSAPAAKAAKKSAPVTKAKPVGTPARARKMAANPMPIDAALVSTLTKKGTLRLVHTTARAGKFTELTIGPAGLLVREGKAGTSGRVVKKLKMAPNALEAWAVRRAKSLLVKGYEAEGVTLVPAMLERWIAEVQRIGMKRSDWDTESEKIFSR